MAGHKKGTKCSMKTTYLIMKTLLEIYKNNSKSEEGGGV